MTNNLKHYLERLAGDFGFLKEAATNLAPIELDADQDREQQELEAEKKNIDDKLDRSAKLDEVDTITFGLETDDGKIVKVYVNKDQANDFEKALSEKLGEIDDIEEVLNTLAKDFEIVDVEWPEAPTDEEDEDINMKADVLNKKVYDNPKEKQANYESYGERVTSKLLEADANTVEARLNTANQLMVYNAILQLGIPEIVLNKSPYRTQIIKGIREKGLELNSNSSMKTALKMFVNRSIDFDEKKVVDESIDTDADNLLVEDARVVNYWEFVTNLIKYLAVDQASADKLLSSQRFKTLVARSSPAITAKVNSQLRTRIKNMVELVTDAVGKNEVAAAGVTESVKPEEAYNLVSDLLKLADGSPDGRLSSAVLDSMQFNQLMTRARAKLSQKFSGVLRSRLNALQKTLADMGVSAAVVAEGILVEYSVKWKFDNVDDNVRLKGDAITITLDPENFEKLLKGITNKDAVIVKDAEDPMIKYAFSPRGSALQVKKVGQNQAYALSSDDVNKLLSVGEKVTEDKLDD